MPYHKSVEKNIRNSKRANVRNRTARSRIRSAITAVLDCKTKVDGQKVLPQAFALIDKGAKQGLLHKNNAANQKSRLAVAVNKLAAA
ncbi:MAG: 30S ribosomal protein S20 [Chitinivibrionales bacterium]|nr:30S ribosomal protein S20 [Chitinivibrionales bacterium]